MQGDKCVPEECGRQPDLKVASHTPHCHLCPQPRTPRPPSSSFSSSSSEGPAEVLAAVLRGAEAVGHAYARAALATSAAATATPAASAASDIHSHPPPPLDAKRATALLRGHILAAWPAMGALLEGTLQARRRHPCLQRFADPAALLLCLLYTVPLLAVAVGMVTGLLIGSLCIQSPGHFKCNSQGEGVAAITGAFLCMGAFDKEGGAWMPVDLAAAFYAACLPPPSLLLQHPSCCPASTTGPCSCACCGRSGPWRRARAAAAPSPSAR